MIAPTVDLGGNRPGVRTIAPGPAVDAALDVAEGERAGDAREPADLGAVDDDRIAGRGAGGDVERRAAARRLAPRESIRSTSSWPG